MEKDWKNKNFFQKQGDKTQFSWLIGEGVLRNPLKERRDMRCDEKIKEEFEGIVILYIVNPSLT